MIAYVLLSLLHALWEKRLMLGLLIQNRGLYYMSAHFLSNLLN